MAYTIFIKFNIKSPCHFYIFQFPSKFSILLFTPPTPLSPQLHNPPPHPPISELAREEEKLAGLRIDAEQWSRSRMGYNTYLTVVELSDEKPLKLPTNDGTMDNRLLGIPLFY